MARLEVKMAAAISGETGTTVSTGEKTTGSRDRLQRQSAEPVSLTLAKVSPIMWIRQ